MTSRQAVLQAIAECDELGRDAFLLKYGFARAKMYVLVHEQREYDSKAIVGVAHGYQFPNQGPLTAASFSGGEQTVRAKLESLGFEVVADPQRSWLFQGNPDVFDVIGYLAACDDVVWSVGQKNFAPKMRPGDVVYFWCAAGKQAEVSGVYARGSLSDRPSIRLDPAESLRFRRRAGGNEEALRVGVRLTARAIDQSRIVGRSQLNEDPVLAEMSFLKMSNATNFALKEAEAARLDVLLAGMGESWVEISPNSGPQGGGARPNYLEFGAAPEDDPDELQSFARRVRRGQPGFRAALLNAYGYRCAVTGWGPETVLEAAHIEPHSISGRNQLDNGLLLRSDIHVLFDLNDFR